MVRGRGDNGEMKSTEPLKTIFEQKDFPTCSFRPYVWAAATEDEGASSGKKRKPVDIALNPGSTIFHTVWTCAFYAFPLGLGVLLCKMGVASSTTEGSHEKACCVGGQFSIGFSASLTSRGTDCFCSGLSLQGYMIAHSLRRQIVFLSGMKDRRVYCPLQKVWVP